MSVLSQEYIQKELKAAFESIQSDSVVLHTDLFRVGLGRRSGLIKQQLADYLSMLIDLTNKRTLLFPVFNYDFCRTGVYDVESDPCQVGVLNEYVRKLYLRCRTRTPIFNFCIYNNSYFSLEAVDNPFSDLSIFGELARHQATIVFLGAPFSANTFIHYVEEMMKVCYRYLKTFNGFIHFNGSRQVISLHYRVRPLIDGAVDYDWQRLYLDLVNDKLLSKFNLGRGQFLCYRTDCVSEYWCSRLHEDEFYFLTHSSRVKIEELYKIYGKPLEYKYLEKKVQP